MYADPIRIYDSGRVFRGEEIPPENVHVPNESVFKTRGDLAKVLRPRFDFIWREFGYQKSHNYAENGEWDPERKARPAGL